MQRYFFDFVYKTRTLHDFEGKEFGSTRAACEQAQIFAMDLQVDTDSEWIGWKVAVRDTLGRELHSIPV